MIPTARNIFTRPPTGTPRRASGPGEGLLIPPTSPEGVGRLFFTARIERCSCSFQACSFSLQGWGLIDLPLRASNEGSPRPRVARAQKIIRLHPIINAVERRAAHDPGDSHDLLSSFESSFSNCRASMGRSSSTFRLRMRSAIP